MSRAPHGSALSGGQGGPDHDRAQRGGGDLAASKPEPEVAERQRVKPEPETVIAAAPDADAAIARRRRRNARITGVLVGVGALGAALVAIGLMAPEPDPPPPPPPPVYDRSWVTGEWCADGDRARMSTITSEGERLTTNFDGNPRVERIETISNNLVRTQYGDYVRVPSDGSVSVVANGVTTRLQRCPAAAPAPPPPEPAPANDLMLHMPGYTSGANDGRNRQMAIVNQTDRVIAAFYASPASTSAWGQNWLVDRQIPGETTIIADVDNGTTECVYDFRVVFEDGQSTEHRSVNVCETSRWKLTPDGESVE